MHVPLQAPDMRRDDFPIQIIEDREGLKNLCSRLREMSRFGFDTEFIGERTYRPRLCLIQVSTEKEVAILDPLGIEDVTPLPHDGCRPAKRRRV